VKKIIIIIPVLMFFFSCGGEDLGGEGDITAPVSVWEIQPGSIEEYVNITGTIHPMKRAVLKSKNTGYYRLMTNPATGESYSMGDNVDRGERIIRLENSELENNIKIRSKKLELETSQLEYEKQKSLYEKGGVTYRELKDAERSRIDALYNYNYAQDQLATLNITSPFKGTIVGLPYHTGGTEVETGEELAEVMDFDSLYLQLSVPGRDFDRVEVGQKTRITHYTLPGDTLSGMVSDKSPVVDPETRSFTVMVTASNPDRKFKPGMFVKADITSARADSAIVIPKDIIMMKDRGKTVFVVEKGSARERVIQTGIENPDSVQVLDGLKLNERLVIKGFETLKDRSRVKVLR